jgi:hypothetical protein
MRWPEASTPALGSQLTSGSHHASLRWVNRSKPPQSKSRKSCCFLQDFPAHTCKQLSTSEPHHIIYKIKLSHEDENVHFVVTNLEKPKN